MKHLITVALGMPPMAMTSTAGAAAVGFELSEGCSVSLAPALFLPSLISSPTDLLRDTQ